MKKPNDSTRGTFNHISILPPDSVATFISEPFGNSGSDPVIRLNFRAAPLDDVLNYLRLTAGFIIRVAPSVDVKAAVEVYDDQPLTQAGALSLLKEAVSEIGCTAIQDGRVVSIIRREDAKKSYIPIPLPGIDTGVSVRS